jgi:hypothetical protein
VRTRREIDAPLNPISIERRKPLMSLNIIRQGMNVALLRPE